ncbi:amino acid ABC transporter permease [Gluconobacter sp. Dm-62]|uniref:amino acid ABC transporter permease n=1 Tax=Gluconobacter sp. Dm-62 TaxID=2799804 RepID=UPI001B8C96CF|nr:amino acid ABC transporter permease [Gluconobacter sp. Dm-62]MBS1101595.1 amino acid ABC transporter permease [Gluconobacter sp. Dm-62]
MHLFLDNFFNIPSLMTVQALLWQGLKFTLLLSAAALPLSLLCGLALALLYSFSGRILRRVLLVLIDLMRAFPVLMMLILIYYSLPFLGITLGSFAAVVAAIVLNNTGYFSEIFRAGLDSIPKGQMEAAQSLGFHRAKAMIYLILPQVLRKVIAPLASNSLELVKTTSIAGLVAIPELLRSAQIAQEQTYNPTPLTAVAVIFFVLLWPFSHWVSRLEQRELSGRSRT